MEYWDVFDRDRRPLGKVHPRGVPMEKGEYHLIVFVWVINGDGQLLLTKRSPEKEHYANFWENTGGAAQVGETSRQAIRRELAEETGIDAAEDAFEFLATAVGKHWLSDTYLLRRDVPLADIRLQSGETCDAKWVTRAQFEAMIARGEVAKPDADRFTQIEPRIRYLFK